MLGFTKWLKELSDNHSDHILFHGIRIKLENRKGSTREGIGPDGKPWKVTMPAHYGEIEKIEGADGDNVDVYVGDNIKSELCYIIDQLNAETGKFDEHKTMLGFDSKKHAEKIYLKGFSDGKGLDRLGSITELSLNEFKDWLKNEDTTIPYKIEESTGGKSLFVFDIDDTLFNTTATVKVMKGTSVVKNLTSAEFNSYKLKPEEHFDYGEFSNSEKFKKESKPIKPMVAKFKAVLRDAGDATVIMLTARADFDDKDLFLSTFKDYGMDMSKVHVHRAGNLPGPGVLPPEKKAFIIRQYLNKTSYTKIRMYDDSNKNLEVFAKLKKEYPNVEFFPYLVDERGGTHLLSFK